MACLSRSKPLSAFMQCWPALCKAGCTFNQDPFTNILTLIDTPAQWRFERYAPIVIGVFGCHRFKLCQIVKLVFVCCALHENNLAATSDHCTAKTNSDKHIHWRNTFDWRTVQTTLMDCSFKSGLHFPTCHVFLLARKSGPTVCVTGGACCAHDTTSKYYYPTIRDIWGST